MQPAATVTPAPDVRTHAAWLLTVLRCPKLCAIRPSVSYPSQQTAAEKRGS